jgi:hypothetical protein
MKSHQEAKMSTSTISAYRQIQDGSKARSEGKKAKTFTIYLIKLLKPNPHEITLEEEN